MGTEWIEDLRVVDLKEELKKRDLAVSGKKAELVARLTEAVEGEANKEAPQSANNKSEEEPAAAAAQEEAAPAAEAETDAPAADGAEVGPGKEEEVKEQAAGKGEQELPDAEAPKGKTPAQTPQEQQPAKGQGGAEDPPTKADADEAKESAAKLEPESMEVDEPEAQQTAPAVEASEAAGDAKTADVAEDAGKGLAPMQAALLAPPAAVAEDGPDAETGEEEEMAVDFEADDVEPPAADPAPAPAPAPVPVTTQAPVEASASKKSKITEPAEQPSSKRQKSDPGTEGKAASGTGKPKREPIPLFKAKSQKAEAAALESTPASARATGGSDTKASVFDRIGGGEGSVPKGSGAPPSRIKATSALLVTGFVRPFRVPAAQDLFKQHGEVKTFWMSSVRDKAYVVFATEDAAEKARQAVHGLEWPEKSRTSLRPKFVPVEEAEEVVKSNGANLPARTSGLFSSRNSGSMTPSTSNAAAAAAAAAAAGTPLEKRKSVQQTAPEEVKKVAKPSEEPEEEQDQFAGLFKKTAAKPHLYYLPLTKEQIAAKHGSGQKPSEVIKSA